MLSKAQTPLRVIFGALWLVFGLNYFFQYLPQQPAMNEAAGQLVGALYQSGLLKWVKIVEVVVGVMLVANLFAPLALVLISPVIVGILYVHLLDTAGLPIAIVFAVINLILAISYKERFASLLKLK